VKTANPDVHSSKPNEEPHEGFEAVQVTHPTADAKQTVASVEASKEVRWVTLRDHISDQVISLPYSPSTEARKRANRLFNEKARDE
jgi:hypothetical protein